MKPYHLFAPLLAAVVGCSADPPPLAMATTPEASKEALVAAFDAWKGGATRDALAARTPPVVFADDALARGHKLLDYKFEGEPKAVGTGITYVLSLTTQDGVKPPATRKLAYRVVTTPNVSISKEDAMP
jgi:hypothetical protein